MDDRYTILRGRDITSQLEDKFFFPVEKRNLYWQSGDLSKGLKISPVRPRFWAIVDLEKEWVFSTVTDDYVLITNKQAYDFGIEICKYLFHVENNEDLKCIRATLSWNRASCRIDLCRFVDFYQPLLNEGWYSFLSIENSYNKTKCLEYNLGFYNREQDYGFGLYGVGFKAKRPHSSSMKAIRKSFYKEIDEKKYNIEWIEESFYKKIQQLKGISISKENMLAMFCRVFEINSKNIKKNGETYRAAKEIKKLVDKSSIEFTRKHGQNAYALLNIFANFQYRYYYPKLGYSLFGPNVILGKWVDDLLSASGKENFSLVDYIGSEAIKAAEWLRIEFPE